MRRTGSSSAISQQPMQSTALCQTPPQTICESASSRFPGSRIKTSRKIVCPDEPTQTDAYPQGPPRAQDSQSLGVQFYICARQE